MTPVNSSAEIAIGDIVRVDGKIGTITGIGDAAAKVRIDGRIRPIKYQRAVRDGYLKVRRMHPNMYKLNAMERWFESAPKNDLVAIPWRGRIEVSPDGLAEREDDVIVAMREVATWLRTKPKDAL